MTNTLNKFIADNEIDIATASVQLAMLGCQYCEVTEQTQKQTVYVIASIAGMDNSQIDFIMDARLMDDLRTLAELAYEDKIEARELCD